MSSYTQSIQNLMNQLARLPGIGMRSAERIAFHLLKQRPEEAMQLSEAIRDVKTRIKNCSTCYNLTEQDPCAICADPSRDTSLLLVVEEVGALWAMERGGAFRGRYHVLGGLLSALDGVGPQALRVAELTARAADGQVREVILALPATVDGQTTAHYLAERLERTGVSVTMLARGVPVGGELDWLDDGTIAQALRARRPA